MQLKLVLMGRLLNNGQSCISAKRIIVTKNNIKSFTKKLINNLDLKIMGDPYDDVDYGPLVSLSARAEVHKMVIINKNGCKTKFRRNTKF